MGSNHNTAGPDNKAMVSVFINVGVSFQVESGSSVSLEEHHLLVCQPEACTHLPHGCPCQGWPPGSLGGRRGVASSKAKLGRG